MKYPTLSNTPIKEIIFSISYDEIVDKGCFENFVNLENVKAKFKDIKPIVTKGFNVYNEEIEHYNNNNGYHLIDDNEIIQLRTGSFSYHFLNSYCDYGTVLDTIITFWDCFYSIIKDKLTVADISVRYINVIEIDKHNPASHLVQLYPKQSNDRNIFNFQNSVSFSYSDKADYIINAVSTQPKESFVLLDISVTHSVKNDDLGLKEKFKPLQEIKNRVFFDSITAKALIKYINNTNHE